MSSDGVSWVSAALAAALIILAAAIGTWDVWLAYRYGWQYTVSATIQRWSQAWPILPLTIGLIMGHLFWPTIPGGQQPPLP